jgi:hypothetical protein
MDLNGNGISNYQIEGMPGPNFSLHDIFPHNIVVNTDNTYTISGYASEYYQSGSCGGGTCAYGNRYIVWKAVFDPSVDGLVSMHALKSPTELYFGQFTIDWWGVNSAMTYFGPSSGTIPMMSTPNMMLRFIDEEENEQFAWVGYRRQGTVTTSNAPYNWEVDVITSTAPGNENSNCDWFAVDYASGGFQWETVDLLPAIVGFPTQGRTVLYFGRYKMVSNLCDGSFD